MSLKVNNSCNHYSVTNTERFIKIDSYLKYMRKTNLSEKIIVAMLATSPTVAAAQGTVSETCQRAVDEVGEEFGSRSS